MRVSESCAACLYEKQAAMTDNQEYLSCVKRILEERSEQDTAPYLIYLFQKDYERLLHNVSRYAPIKKQYNDLLLSMETDIRERILKDADPLRKALFLARIGNYIDFGAMTHVDKETFLELISNPEISEHDQETYLSFLKSCENAENFLLLADNCGEIVLDKLMLEQLSKQFPKMRLHVLVRGSEVLNDATPEDAQYVGLDQWAEIISNGQPIAGTVYELLTDEAKQALKHADVILSKGQGNYESISGQGFHIYYAFLCKCELFTSRFQVPKLTGMFVEEK